MFKALVESDENAPAVAKELAASDGNIVVSWTELGLSGIRKLSHLFSEFAARNETVTQLGRNGEVFNPAPNPRYQQPGDELFVAELAQPSSKYGKHNSTSTTSISLRNVHAPIEGVRESGSLISFLIFNRNKFIIKLPPKKNLIRQLANVIGAAPPTGEAAPMPAPRSGEEPHRLARRSFNEGG